MKYQCTIHNIKFDVDTYTNRPVECPVCLQDALAKLRNEYTEVKRQRDVLVDAMSIVKTVQEIK